MDKTENGQREDRVIFVYDTGKATESVGVEFVLVTTAQAPGKEATTLTHQVSTEAVEIVKVTMTTTGIDLQRNISSCWKRPLNEANGWVPASISASPSLGALTLLLKRSPQKKPEPPNV